jgi:hypothetical protein
MLPRIEAHWNNFKPIVKKIKVSNVKNIVFQKIKMHCNTAK